MEFPTTPDASVTDINVQIYGQTELSFDFRIPTSSMPGLTDAFVVAAYLDFVSVLVAEADANKPALSTVTAHAYYIGTANAEVTIP